MDGYLGYPMSLYRRRWSARVIVNRVLHIMVQHTVILETISRVYSYIDISVPCRVGQVFITGRMYVFFFRIFL